MIYTASYFSRNPSLQRLHTRLMFELDNARYLLVSALPNPSAWSGSAALTFEQEVRDLMAELATIRSLLWG
ncbi:MAG: hypothetical protein EBS38_03530 [Actinobacteria bacterium]|nr:hypothetical protein [Actinomycetota bacterium]